MGKIEQDRRTENRAATVFRPVLVDTNHFGGFCLMRNLSSTGMMGKVYTAFAVGTAVMIQFDDALAVTGVTVWSKDGLIGVRFDEEIDVAEVLSLSRRRANGGKPLRAPRLSIRERAEVVVENRSLQVEVLDISQRGAKVAASILDTEDEVVLVLKGMEPRKAMVRWTQSGIAGLKFHTVLEFEQLADWVIGRQQLMASEQGTGSDFLRLGSG